MVFFVNCIVVIHNLVCSFTIMSDIFSLVWVTELPPLWEIVANSACHILILWQLNCICLPFPFGDNSSIWISLYQFLSSAIYIATTA